MAFELWRQDDNGNRFLVGTFAHRSQAEERMAELTRIPHKQTYWIIENTHHASKGDGNARETC